MGYNVLFFFVFGFVLRFDVLFCGSVGSKIKKIKKMEIRL